MTDKFTGRLNEYLKRYFIPEILSDELVDASSSKESDSSLKDIKDISQSNSE